MSEEIKKDSVELKFDGKFLRMFDLKYEEGKHYYDATRRSADNLVATKPRDEFEKMLPDAVTCFVVVRTPDDEPRLLLSYEYRYPTGRFLLSPPAGLIDPGDAGKPAPLLEAASREIFEETGIRIKESDRIFVVNPLVFSTPGMTDECNALVCAVIDLDNLECLTQEGAEGAEKFQGFELVNKEAAEMIVKNGCDKEGTFLPLYTWAALMFFLREYDSFTWEWEEKE